MPTYRLDIAYHGAGFHGYAAQPAVRTVQGELERALERHTGPVDTFVSGRTDKGVHATAQVVSFSVDRQLDTAYVVRSLNRQLAPEVGAYSLAPTSPDFHARFSATGRAYAYRVLNRDAPDPLRADVTWHVTDPLEIDAMNEAVATLVGVHDFASFCRRAQGRTSVRDLRSAQWERVGDLVVLRVAASSFCHQMVRSMVALAVDVGRGKVRAAAVPGILEARDRQAARGVAPPHGLTLVRVEFGPDMEASDHPV